MSSTGVADRKATEKEVRGRAGDEPGYRSVLRLSTAASEIVGVYVHVITDDDVEAELAPL